MKRLVAFDGFRDTPPELLRQLREIDPAIELIAIDERTWWLGSVSQNKYRRQAGERILENESRRMAPNPRNVILGKLSLQGFARIQVYTCEGNPQDSPCIDGDGNLVPSIVEDFRERNANWEKDQGKAVFEERTRFSNGAVQSEYAAALLRDKLLTDGRAAFRKANRGSVTTFGGL